MGRERAGTMANLQDRGTEDGDTDSVFVKGIRDFLE